ncbi:DNA glycosylase AlkZ-like family protein [Actinoplanes sp. M2I2]|uniref:DNA glycosylase AlkZ-like family protein n=1 Tax=Actinoplanes sp. M2I2 TaxID=1734444 RepID=UPI002021BFF1|nr:crosslink repair DNA glycosylase YcaQ family protein [Actinoplanes sp. M2I2]
MAARGRHRVPAPSAARGVRLLSYFDAYGVGAHPRAVTFPGRAFERALDRGQAGNHPVLLIDGRAAGVWHQRRSAVACTSRSNRWSR